MLYIFSKTDCGPCILVKKYFKAMDDPRTEQIEEVLLDNGCPQENLDLATTPVSERLKELEIQE